ncbi:MAG: Uma2 family endonuclease [Gammaproteobacteria bacterium]|nr:Uma2 family endonuclease [Gammaproteobacteria bacterium]MCI0590041.1 Uma2 family endonuclease [Gammaproteobacteria bacterium]
MAIPEQATAQVITAEDLLRMPNDGLRYELIRGELRKMSPAGYKHGRVVINVTTPLDQYVRAHNLGVVFAAETGFKLASNPDHVRAPDVAFIRRERVEQSGEVEGYWPGAPDLAVEVVSPGDSYTEVEDKVFDWLEAGTRMVIVVNPRKRAVTIYRSLTDVVVLAENDMLEGGDMVPGWTIPVKDLFA